MLRPSTLLTLACCITIAIFSQKQIHALAHNDADAMLYLPNEKLLTHFTGGMDSVIADLLWLQCIQYTGEQVQGAHDYEWLSHMINTVVRLDPYFKDAYRFGAIFLAALEDDQDGTLDLLHRGMVHLPNDPDLPHEAAMIYLLNKREEPGARKMAARYATIASKRPGAGNQIARLAAALQSEQNLEHLEEDMWRARLESEDKLIRDMADQKLRTLGARNMIQELNKLVRTYEEGFGQRPQSLQTLIDSGLVLKEHAQTIQHDPLGGTYFIDPNGQVQSTGLLDEEVQHLLGKWRKALKAYQKEHNTWPPTLQDLITSPHSPWPGMPLHPYPDQTWDYDPTTGTLTS